MNKHDMHVPCDGIWDADHHRAGPPISDIVPRNAKLPSNNGCCNYFVAGMTAPVFADVDVATFDVTLRSAYWRLLWEDRRYVDGIIPDESGYFQRQAVP
ncbi:hypothetical protein DIE23_16620 [Burkholderia sp. Bp9143]|uniref:Imm72 family immunity protein n=1 Tax=Burkholderia sp. Bp9143 TaxID=2184574 RepID=UPI000F59214C|nr:Imm72 family immunity protein [Burkholderia sp. Bp9143]RQR32172.1 hypothetical protein DIE23_16620 [Burkholderia sp. Bp9143]